MAKKLKAINTFILFEKSQPDIDGIKSSLLLSPDDVNPGLSYGKVISVGFNVGEVKIGDFIYCLKGQAIEINHNYEKLFLIKEEFVTGVAHDEE